MGLMRKLTMVGLGYGAYKAWKNNQASSGVPEDRPSGRFSMRRRGAM